MEGFIKLYRSLLDWEWYVDTNTRLVFIHLLLNANWEESKYKGYDVPKGGLVVGLNSLSESIGISVQSVRTALNHLKSTGEITIKSTNKFSIITIANWEKYQGFSEEVTSKPTGEITNNQQTTNKQLTTEEEYNNIRIKEDNNIIASPDIFIRLMLNDKSEYEVTEEEVKQYQELYPSVDVKQQFRSMKGWCDSNPTKRKTRTGIKRFINSWLNRKQNNGNESYEKITDKQKISQEKGYQNGSNADFLKMLEEESRR